MMRVSSTVETGSYRETLRRSEPIYVEYELAMASARSPNNLGLEGPSDVLQPRQVVEASSDNDLAFRTGASSFRSVDKQRNKRVKWNLRGAKAKLFEAAPLFQQVTKQPGKPT